MGIKVTSKKMYSLIRVELTKTPKRANSIIPHLVNIPGIRALFH